MVDYPFVSVVVPVLNRQKTVGACLESLLNLDYPHFEVIVVDGGSRDRTREIVAEYSVKLLIDERRGAYAARNTGIEMAKGEMVFFTDSDCIADRDVLKNLVRNLVDRDAAGVRGQISSYKPTTLVERFSDLAGIVKFSLPKGPLKWDKDRFLSGGIYTANAMYRRNVLEEVGGFDMDFTVGGDYDLAWRVQRAGYRVIFDPEAIVYHAHRSTLPELIKQFFNYGREQAVKLKKQPERSIYIDIKTYILPTYSFRCELPCRALITIDFFNLSMLFLLLALISPIFLYLSLPFLLSTFLGALYTAWGAVKDSEEYRWLILYPLLHMVRHISWFVGRLYGSIRYRSITF